MKKALAIGLAAVMAISMSAPVFAEDEGKGIAKEDLKVGVIYIGDENEGYTAAHMKGIDEMEEKLGLDDSQIIEKTLTRSVPDTDTWHSGVPSETVFALFHISHMYATVFRAHWQLDAISVLLSPRLWSLRISR